MAATETIDEFIKDPHSVETFTVVWCKRDGTNLSELGGGDLQGETIATIAAQVPTGITLSSENKNSTIIAGVTYPINTVHNIILSGGAVNATYDIISRITTSGGRTLDKTIRIIIQEQ